MCVEAPEQPQIWCCHQPCYVQWPAARESARERAREGARARARRSERAGAKVRESGREGARARARRSESAGAKEREWGAAGDRARDELGRHRYSAVFAPALLLCQRRQRQRAQGSARASKCVPRVGGRREGRGGHRKQEQAGCDFGPHTRRSAPGRPCLWPRCFAATGLGLWRNLRAVSIKRISRIKALHTDTLLRVCAY